MSRATLMLAGLAWLACAAPAMAQQKFVLPEAPRQTFSDCKDCPTMVVLPSGLAMSQTPVTKAQFTLFVKETNFTQQDWGCVWGDPEFPQAQNHPVVCVSWNDAAAFAAWLAGKSGKAYRLPTLDEMRYAAAGGESTPYWWGQDAGSNRANCRQCGSKWDGKGTAPVASFRANRYGIGDAVGNVWIWTSSCHDPACKERMLFGGAWSSPPSDLRASRAIWNETGLRFNTYGFRVVIDAS
jgi:formylglycine-generating enzyme required for sulfatase activity